MQKKKKIVELKIDFEKSSNYLQNLPYIDPAKRRTAHFQLLLSAARF